MGITIPRPAMRAREARMIHAKLEAYNRKVSFLVVDLDDLSEHGLYPSLEEALGCVAFDGLSQWQVWRGDILIRSEENKE